MKQKIKSYNLGQLKGAWGAGMAMSSKNDGLINMFFHELNERGGIERQGMIVKKYRDDEYFVMLARFTDGCYATDKKIINFKEKENFLFYDTAEEMRFNYARLNNWDNESTKAQELLIRMQGGD